MGVVARRFRRTRSYPRPENIRLAEKRLRSVLGAHGVATGRTLEQKISDAGPVNQRMEPHIVTMALGYSPPRRAEILVYKDNPAWYCLAETPSDCR